MYKQVPHVVFAVMAGLALAAGGSAFSQELELLEVSDVQPEFPKILRQPEDQAIPIGANVTFTVKAENGESFQWVRNEVVLEGQTNDTITLENVGTDDVGLYACYVIKGEEAVPTRAAVLNVYAATSGGGAITVFGTPVMSGGGQGSCPGPYVGYVFYSKTISQGWGWVPTAGTTVHTATDLNRNDTKVHYFGKYGDLGCNPTSVTVPHPTFSQKYRFTIYFTNNVPTNAYAITLVGFNP